MEIEIKQTIKCQNRWYSKWYGVILVKTEEDKKILYDLLVKQDEYWNNKSNLITVFNDSIKSELDLKMLCDYVYKTDIYNIPYLKTKVDFLIYQFLFSDDYT